MRIKKSIQMEGWIGFFDNDEDGHPEEFLSVKTIDKAQKIVNQLRKDIENLTKHNIRKPQSAKLWNKAIEAVMRLSKEDKNELMRRLIAD